MELKKSLRTQILIDRKNFDENKYFHTNNNIVKSVQDVLNSLTSQTKSKNAIQLKPDILDKVTIVGLYLSMKGEPDLLELANLGLRVAIPKFRDTSMDFVMYEIGEELERSGFGNLMQPRRNRKLSPNVIVIPGMAFSINGDRLGFGTGHYDRYFAKVKSTQNVTKIGVCFHENLYEYLPREYHDIKLDYIITDKTTIAL